MLTIGHRGAMGYAPENTLLSIRKTIELSADWVEVDVYLVDGQLIVIHDDTLERTTNGIGSIFDYSVEQLRQLDAGQGEKIPLLQEVIDLTSGKLGLNIEIKGDGVAEPLVKLLLSLSENHRKKILVSSFNMQELLTVYEGSVQLNLGVLVEDEVDDGFKWAHRLNAYSIHFDIGNIVIEQVERAHEAKLKVYVYTVNSHHAINDMRQMGIDGVFTNYPDRVKLIL